MNTIICHTFSKQQVENLDFAQFESIYGHWPQLWGQELGAKYNSLIFAVGGYDSHPEEIYTIPEVRRFYRQLHQQWPWWLFFLSDLGDNIPVSYLCLFDSLESRKVDGASNCAAIFAPKDALNIIMHDLGRMVYLMDNANVDEEEIDRRSRAILKRFTGDKV